MPYLWSILIDIGVFLPFYVPPKYTVILHAICTTIVSAATLMTAGPELVLNGLPQWSDELFFHKLLGTFIFALIIMQIVLGIISKLNKSS